MEGWGDIGGEHKVLASYKAKAATEEGRDDSASEGKEEEWAAASFFLNLTETHFLRLWNIELQMRGAEGKGSVAGILLLLNWSHQKRGDKRGKNNLVDDDTKGPQLRLP